MARRLPGEPMKLEKYIKNELKSLVESRHPNQDDIDRLLDKVNATGKMDVRDKDHMDRLVNQKKMPSIMEIMRWQVRTMGRLKVEETDYRQHPEYWTRWTYSDPQGNHLLSVFAEKDTYTLYIERNFLSRFKQDFDLSDNEAKQLTGKWMSKKYGYLFDDIQLM